MERVRGSWNGGTLAALLFAAGCAANAETSDSGEGASSPPASPSGAVGPAVSPPESEWIDAAGWTALRALSPATLPAPPKDASNEVADDPKAAQWGQRLFFDPGFSGALLESDNDGKHHGVGLQGEVGKVSCASCHVAEDGFSDTRTIFGQISLASGWSKRKAPSILDVGQAKLLMWDGRFDSLQRQVLGVFESPMEGNSSRLFFAQEVARRYAAEYQAIFGADPTVILGDGFPKPAAAETGCDLELTSATTPDEECSKGTKRGVPGASDYDALGAEQQREVTTVALNAGKAIAAYERKLSCGTSRFDAFVHGDKNAMTASEQRGAALFVGKAKCVDCHGGPFFSDQKFHNVGMFPTTVAAAFITKDDPGAEKGLAQVIADPLNVKGVFAASSADDGRIPATVSAGMLGAFRTPMLRCASSRPSFMHTAQMKSMKEVVVFFNEGGHAKVGEAAAPVLGYLGRTELAPLGLADAEVDDLVAFLGALEGPGPSRELLTDPSKNQ